MKKIVATLRMLSKQDPNLCVEKGAIDTTFGHNPDYLLDTYGITKTDLIRLERLGLALKARYETRHPRAEFYEKLNEKRDPSLPPFVCKSGTHRVRWVLFRPEAK